MLRIIKKGATKILRIINSAAPEICRDVSLWAAKRSLFLQELAKPLYRENRSYFSNEEMAVAMVDTHREVLSRPQNLVLIEKARVRETLGLVELPDGSVLLEGNWWEPLLRQHPTYRKRIGFKRHNLRGDVYSLLAMWSTSFYHWLHDVLPRLEAALPHLQQGTKFLINENPTRWQLDTLGAYGIFECDLEIQPANARTEIERLWFATPAGQTGFGSRDLLKKVSSRLRKHFNTQTLKKRCGIFVSRAKSRCRRFTNESEVLVHLLEHNFEKIFCEDLSISQQIEAFWNASEILAPHGAGLTNIMFCQAGTSVGEVHYAETVYNDHYWMLAQQFELSHTHLGAQKIDLLNGEYNLEANLWDIENWLAGKAQGARR